MENQNNQLQPLSGQRQNKESDRAVQACNDWLRLGSGRTLTGLLQIYTDKVNFSNDFIPPSTTYTTISKWSSHFGWAKRATEYDATWEERKNAEREAVFQYNVALDYERVKKLQRLALFLESQLYERGIELGHDEDGELIEKPGQFHNVWLPDVKQIGSGEDVERVDIERFNAAIISEYRSVLDDIAKETGGRIRKSEIAGKDGKPLIINVVKMDIDEL
jgi:hypothetical protein